MLVEQIETALVSRHIVAMKGNGGTTRAKMTGASNVIPRPIVNVACPRDSRLFLGVSLGDRLPFDLVAYRDVCHFVLRTERRA